MKRTSATAFLLWGFTALLFAIVLTSRADAPAAVASSPATARALDTLAPVSASAPLTTATPIRTPTITATPTPPTCRNYSYTIGSGTITPGQYDIGNHCDDCTTAISLPFAYVFYEQPFSGLEVSSNGILLFNGGVNAYPWMCPPVGLTYTAMVYWDDLLTNCTGCGVLTSVTGTEPDRVFNIEWRAQTFGGGISLNFEARLYEGQQKIDFVYNPVPRGAALVGLVRDASYFICYPGWVGPGIQLTWVWGPCGGTVTPTRTATPTFTGTPTATPPLTYTDTPTATPTPCAMSFTDVMPSDWFYQYVRCLYCRGAISGYADNTFRPYNNLTRGQAAKIVVIAFDVPINTNGGPHFTDVPPDSPFYVWIESAYNRGIVSGYSDGTYRPGNNLTRAQLVKMVCLAAGWPLIDPLTPTFTDVSRGSAFYTYIETAYCHGVLSGYADGTFRPNASITRAQVAKVVCLAVTGSPPPCATPTVVAGRR